MSSVRSDVDFEGIGLQTATFKIDNSIVFDSTKEGNSEQVGLAVTIVDDKTVGLVGDGEPVLGKLLVVEGDDCATVQIGGGATLPGGTGATLTPGSKIVGDLLVAAKGYIRSIAASGAAYAEAAADETQNGAHKILDATDSDAVQVWLS